MSDNIEDKRPIDYLTLKKDSSAKKPRGENHDCTLVEKPKINEDFKNLKEAVYNTKKIKTPFAICNFFVNFPRC